MGVRIAYVFFPAAEKVLMLICMMLANLQVPYLLNLAVLTTEFLPLFPASERSTQATFRLLWKLDEAFSSLLTGHDLRLASPCQGLTINEAYPQQTRFD
jgi:hypothetical protein